MNEYTAPPSDDRHIWDLWLTGTYQGTIVAADDAGLFDALATRAATAEELAQRLDFDVRATRIVLRLLAALGLLVARRGAYQLTDQARHYLVRSSPFYWGHMLRAGVSEWHRATALAKQRRGTAVSGPAATSSASIAGPRCAKASVPRAPW